MRRLVLAALILWPAGQIYGQKGDTGDTWSARKCALYAEAWQAALAARGTAGLSDAFRANHDAFLTSGCTRPHDVCPRSAEERALADLLTVLSMNEGMASTFVPFACPG